MSYLYEKYDYSLFRSRFEDYGRHDQFSDAGLRALFHELVRHAEDTMEPLEVDVVALCCDFIEVDIEDLKEQVGCDLEELEESTAVIHVDDETIIYQVF